MNITAKMNIGYARPRTSNPPAWYFPGMEEP